MKRLILIIIAALLIKIFYFLFALSISQFKLDYHVSFSKDGFYSIFERNDAGWYKIASDNGYPKITDPLDLGYSNKDKFKQSVWAFFPLYPLIIRSTENLTNTNFSTSAFIISLIFSTLAFILFYILCIKVFEKNESESFIITLLFILAPFHYYFSMFYTEAIFFGLLALSFIAIHDNRMWLVSIALIPLTLIRPNGIICIIPLVIYYIERKGGFKLFFTNFKLYSSQNLKLLWFLSGPITLIIYCIYQYQMTGFYLAFVKAQAGWYKEAMFPLLALFRRGDIATQFNSIYTILIMILSILVWKKFPLSLNIFIWFTILIPMSSGSVLSMPRFISVCFPLIIYFGSFILRFKFKYLILSGVFLMQLLTFYTWLIGTPFSY